MCGRYRLTRPDRLAAMRDALPTFEEFSELHITPRYNVAPTQDGPIVRANAAGHPRSISCGGV